MGVSPVFSDKKTDKKHGMRNGVTRVWIFEKCVDSVEKMCYNKEKSGIRKGENPMRITFLGSSHGVPEPGRKCSAVLVTVGENRYLVDIGCDVVPELVTRNIDMKSVKGIFVSHPHGDHCNGIFAFVELANWYATGCNPKILFPIDGVEEMLKKWASMMSGGREMRPMDIGTYTAGVIFDDGALKVTAIPTKHCGNSYAFVLEADGKKVLYTGDLTGTAEDFPHEAAAAGADLLIGESAHFSTLKYVELLKDKPIKAVAVTHHFAPNEQFLEAKKALKPLPMTLVYDGMEFEL